MLEIWQQDYKHVRTRNALENMVPIEAFRSVGKIERAAFAAAAAHPQHGGQVTSIPAGRWTRLDELNLMRGEG